MTAFRRWFWALALLVLAIAPAPARAGNMFGFAEWAVLRSGNVGCSIAQTVSSSAGAYTAVKCTAGSVGRFVISVPFPREASNSWSYKVTYANFTGGVCAWTVNAYSFGEGAGSVAGVDSSLVTSASTSDFLWHVTSASPSTVVDDDANSGSACTGSPSSCAGTWVQLFVTLDAAHTTVANGNTCDFRMIEADF